MFIDQDFVSNSSVFNFDHHLFSFVGAAINLGFYITMDILSSGNSVNKFCSYIFWVLVFLFLYSTKKIWLPLVKYTCMLSCDRLSYLLIFYSKILIILIMTT